MSLGLIFVALALLLQTGVAQADRLDDLARTLDADRNEKARIAAAVALGQLANERCVPSLMRALTDTSSVVRSVSASALGHIGDPRAIPALERALSDDNPTVRSAARDALGKLRPQEIMPVSTRIAPREPKRRPPKLYIVVNMMGNKSSTSKGLATQMRTMVMNELGLTPDFTLDAAVGNGKLAQFNVDGSITRIKNETRGPFVETTCEVQLTISNARGSIMSIVSGGATVQTPRSAYKRNMDETLQLQALEGAVMSAHKNLSGFLVRQIASN
jgi:hypothetical protein